MIRAIRSFDGAYRFLSNFYIEPDGTHVEGEYQQAKCKKESDRRRFTQMSPAQAKKVGRLIELREDWEDVKVSIMQELVTAKFRNPQLGDLLRQTRGLYLEEGGYWGDTFWGVCRGSGRNMLGHILMEVRSQLR